MNITERILENRGWHRESEPVVRGILKKLYLQLLEINDMHEKFVLEFCNGEDRTQGEMKVFCEYMAKYGFVSSYLKKIFEFDLTMKSLNELRDGIKRMVGFMENQKVLTFDFLYFFKLNEAESFIYENYFKNKKMIFIAQ